MRNSEKTHFYKINFSKIAFIVLIIILIAIPDFGNAKLFPDEQNIEEKAHIIFPADSLTPEEVIKADIIAQNNHDLSTYLSLRTTKVGPPENRNEIMILREKYPEYDILQNTVEARLSGITSIPLTLIESITKIDEYFNLFSEIEAYYVAIDYQLENENQYVYNGVNYRLYLLALEEDQWVIIQISHIPVHRMIEEGYGFGTPEEKIALKIQKRRECTGEFINPKGEIIENKK